MDKKEQEPKTVQQPVPERAEPRSAAVHAEEEHKGGNYMFALKVLAILAAVILVSPCATGSAPSRSTPPSPCRSSRFSDVFPLRQKPAASPFRKPAGSFLWIIPRLHWARRPRLKP